MEVVREKCGLDRHQTGTLLFLHVPKTGGTTLNQVLRRVQPDAKFCWLDSTASPNPAGDFAELPPCERMQADIVSGHLEFGFHHYVRPPVTYITLIRHPLERIISHYYYVLRCPAHYLHSEVVRRRMDLATYATSGLSPELDNGQTRVLSGHFGAAGSCSTQHLTAARCALREHFAMTGITELFDESLLLLQREFGWQVPPYYVPQNVTPQRPGLLQLSAATICAIAQANSLDMELYEHVRTEFERLVEGLGETFQNDLARFRRGNALYQKRQRARCAARNFIQAAARAAAIY